MGCNQSGETRLNWVGYGFRVSKQMVQKGRASGPKSISVTTFFCLIWTAEQMPSLRDSFLLKAEGFSPTRSSSSTAPKSGD